MHGIEINFIFKNNGDGDGRNDKDTHISIDTHMQIRYKGNE